jgi:hypothetical protein
MNLIKEFERRLDTSINPNFTDRKSRNDFVARSLLADEASILNIGGGGKRHLKEALDDEKQVFEIDMEGDCDLRINLDKIDRLEFQDESFDLCCAFDVLEHLEQFHLIYAEMLRIARQGVLVSLPVSSSEIPLVLQNRKRKIPNLETGIYSKFYGLPLQHPTDRHRWWLYFDDIVTFFLNEEAEKPIKVSFYIRQSISWKGKMIRLISKRIYYNFVTPYIFIRITKNAPLTSKD